MNQQELTALFDQQAPHYDKQWSRMSPIADGLHFFLEHVLAGLPPDANVLCVGVGTGRELLHLARRFPGWRFTAVEPSGAMLDQCRRHAERAGFTSRCRFHQGYLEALPPQATHDAATCLLVSQFILDPGARSALFAQIAANLQPGGILVSSDLAFDTRSEQYQELLSLWLTLMANGQVSEQEVSRIKAAYGKDVAILPPGQIASIIEAGGFSPPVSFYQAGLIQAFYARRIDT
ncbi:class I SAM-dependent methyltransferase [Bowmanella dokdonensis]|uniref:Class I SAM-dependent methyltransferase n=1 Tax=Bowmanella dokdonensis TaxID=751969 RepID=A0A939DRK2_9ALTE|nr:class I SAM-dependent methyltransferase [Bowmanella dokdonensis]MBN7827673.1 class I SAM-dependent methyltransferase [Bowmanella dokdonensis]